jgi:hypothetical protein
MTFKILNKLIVSIDDATYWRVEIDWKVSVNEHIYVVPKHFHFNFASTPRFTWIIFPPATGLYKKATALHDWMYSTNIVSRKYADTIFYHFMLHCKVNPFKAKLMYLAVKYFGRKAYKK